MRMHITVEMSLFTFLRKVNCITQIIFWLKL